MPITTAYDQAPSPPVSSPNWFARNPTNVAMAKPVTAATARRSGTSAAATRDAAIIAVQPIATLTPVGVRRALLVLHIL
ncbi:hypothetical protein ACIBD9_18090 [Micromonospora sp. NPDC050784]|uniref:hypothetical protein n=1 Tax=Micromonospora sp. NPDC050784 TaxID=3364281 RepID=UPI0037BCF6CB